MAFDDRIVLCVKDGKYPHDYVFGDLRELVCTHLVSEIMCAHKSWFLILMCCDLLSEEASSCSLDGDG